MSDATAVDQFYRDQRSITLELTAATRENKQSYYKKRDEALEKGEELDQDTFFETTPKSIDLQTKDFFHSAASVSGDARAVFETRANLMGGIATLILGDPRYSEISNTRIIYNLNTPPGAASGEGGIEALDPNFQAGAAWAPISTTAVAFSVYDAVAKGFLPGRRPGRGGYLINHPDRFATIRVMNHKGEPIFATSDFTLEQVTRPKRERLNPQITFDEVIARFGSERMKVYSFQGKLLDAANFDWMRQWDEYWEKFMRGEVLARNLWRAYVLYKGKIIGGYMVSTTINENASGPVVSFGFTMLVTDDENIPRLNLITTNDEDILYDQYEGTREEFDAEMGNLRFNMESSPGYLKSINSRGPNLTKDPAESTVINEDIINETEAESDAE